MSASDAWLDKVRLAKELYGTLCPVCDRPWTCGQDVDERKPTLFDDGSAACEECYREFLGLPSAKTLFQQHLQRCLEYPGKLSWTDQQFLANIAASDEEDLKEEDCLRLTLLYERLGDP